MTVPQSSEGSSHRRWENCLSAEKADGITWRQIQTGGGFTSRVRRTWWSSMKTLARLWVTFPVQRVCPVP